MTSKTREFAEPHLHGAQDVSHLENRLEMFARLEDGPLEEGDEAAPPSKEGIAWLRRLLLRAMAMGRLPLPYLYPTPEGGVLAAWSHSPWEASAEFNLQTRTAALHAADVTTGETYTAVAVFATDEEAGLKEFTRFLRKFIPGPSSEASVRQVEERIKGLQGLKPGWLGNGHGRVLPAEGLSWLEGLLMGLMVERYLPEPRLYATPGGEVEAEWSFGAWEISATIDLEKKSAWMHAANVETLEDAEERLDIGELTGVESFVAFLMRYGMLGS